MTKEFKAKGYVLFTRNTTPLEDGEALFIRAKADASDLLRLMYKNPNAEYWRIAEATLTCTVPQKPKVSKANKPVKVKKKGAKK